MMDIGGIASSVANAEGGHPRISTGNAGQKNEMSTWFELYHECEF